jgi:putative membrane protein
MSDPQQSANASKQDKFYFRIVLVLSIIVFLLVVLLNEKVLPKPFNTPSMVYVLPKLNAFINGTCALLLMLSLYFIKQKNISAHKKINITAFILSAVFLVSYVIFHYFVDDTTFPKDNPLRPLYLGILIPHIILAALVLPLVLLSFYHGIKMNVEKHKKLVRFSYPIWLFVTISGVIVYLMISPHYKF